jgi:cell wall-associated NlpC family hydrolase
MKELDEARRLLRIVADRVAAALASLDEHPANIPVRPPPQPVPDRPPLTITDPDEEIIRDWAPTPAAEPSTFLRVFATCWGNEEDEDRAHWEEFAYPWAVPQPHSGMHQLGAALPARVTRGTLVRVRMSGSPSKPFIEVPVIDVGPWNTKDAYWRTGERPQAESGTDISGRKTNKAGVDFTPAVWAALTGKTPEECWRGSPSGYVDLQVVEPAGPKPAPAPPVTAEGAVNRARSAVGGATRYRLGAGGGDPALPLPTEADCSGFADWCLGLSRDRTGLNTDALVRDGKTEGGLFDQVDQAKPGDLIVYPSGNGRDYGHVGVITEVESGKPKKVVHCSSGQTPAIQETGPELFLQRGAIVVRRKGLA